PRSCDTLYPCPYRYTTLFRSVLAHKGAFDTEAADAAGLVTFAPDDLDWEDEIRVAIEERTSLSPDALTGMEARFAPQSLPESRLDRKSTRLNSSHLGSSYAVF